VSTLSFLISWGNAPFAIAIGVVGTFVLLQATGVLGLLAGGGGDGGEGEHDVGAGNIDHDVDAAAHQGEGEDDRDAGAHGRSFAAAILAPLGFGTIPFSVIWETFALVFAAVGVALNLRYLDYVGGPPLYTLAWTTLPRRTTTRRSGRTSTPWSSCRRACPSAMPTCSPAHRQARPSRPRS
jgi:hypothetical protein